MPTQYVPPSATKTRLLNGLGLSVGNQDHERLYMAIKADTDRGYDILCQSNQNLKPQDRNHQGRWTYNIVKDEAILAAIRQIESFAQPGIRAWYQHWGVAGTGRNFVIDWFLWHAFRNKDPRNKRKTETNDFHADDDDHEGNSGGGGVGGGGGSSSKVGKSTSGTSWSSASRYDPVRNINVPNPRST